MITKMDVVMKSRKKFRQVRIKIIRIILSLILLPFFGIVFYFWLTGLYREPIFIIYLIFALPRIYLIMLLPAILYTAMMEYLGIRLIQKSEKILITALLYLATGSLIFILYDLIFGRKFDIV